MTLPTLTAREFVDLEYLIVHAPQSKERYRAQALLWRATGETAADVSERLYVSPRTVYNWVHRFQHHRDDDIRQRLADASRSGRPPTALGIIDPLIVEVIDQDPRHLGYHATVWTAPLLAYHLQAVHEVEVSRKSVSRALVRLGFRWKRPRYALANRPDTWRQAKGG